MSVLDETGGQKELNEEFVISMLRLPLLTEITFLSEIFSYFFRVYFMLTMRSARTSTY